MIQNIDSIRSWLALTYAPRLGPVQLHFLLDFYKNPEAILNAGRSAWQEANLSEKTIHYLSAPDWEKVENDIKWAEQENASILTLEDRAYPQMLKNIADPPTVLYILGQAEILSQPQLAIVGSRNPSHAGLDTAHHFAALLASMGMTITSGLAIGIDAAAHKGALSSIGTGSGTTIAVAGTGLDRVYPARHRNLAHKIMEKGVLISEYGPGTPPLPANFPRRNRIISGLSMGVLVVEAAVQSGSLITARCAIEQGREVFAIPGSIHHALAKGSHTLIRQGAKLVETAEHIMEELSGFITMYRENNPPSELVPESMSAPVPGPEAERLSVKKHNAQESATLNIDFEYKEILNCIDFEPTSVDKVVERSGLTADAVCSMLLVLELHGYITALSGGYYCQSR